MSDMKIQKYIREEDGYVGVLVSPGYGAGWSTWVGEEYKRWALFDKTLVEMALNKATTVEVETYANTSFGSEDYICLLGWKDVEVEFLPQGTKFVIREYDGLESLEMADSLVETA